MISEPVVAPLSAPMPNFKPSIPYPSRCDNERRRMDECLALADLGTSINLMPLSMWKGLSLPELTLTCMTLELADQMESKPVGIAKDVKTSRALIDVHKGELTLRIGNEDVTYNLDQTSRYSANYDQMTANKIDIANEACEEYSQEVLGFFDVTTSGSPTPFNDPIVSTTSPTLTPFGDSDFLLFEEADAFLGLEDDPDSPKLDPSYYDPEGDILSLEAILNSDPSPPLLNHEQSVPSFKEELKACEAKTIKSSIDEPPEVELKDLPPNLEYAFLEGDNKLPAIIAKELKDEEKSALIKTGRALIYVHKGELTLRIEKEAITYNLDQTARYSANYNQMIANKIDVICEEYSQEVLGFSDVTASGNPTPYDDPIVSTTSPTLTTFRDSDFLLFEEADAFLGLEDDPNSPKINPFYYDQEGDILLLEAILNSEPLPPLPNHEQYLPLFKKELKVCEAKTVKSFVDEPPEVELKDLPPHLEYVFLEGDKKFPVIIAKELGDEEKSVLMKVLKSHKRAIAWKLSDICIDYRKLNEATRKDHFPLPFMDQMLE
nr:reverse transcriptase domain-containing protein [Tanacetum cinerariifolium]